MGAEMDGALEFAWVELDGLCSLAFVELLFLLDKDIATATILPTGPGISAFDALALLFIDERDEVACSKSLVRLTPEREEGEAELDKEGLAFKLFPCRDFLLKLL